MSGLFRLKSHVHAISSQEQKESIPLLVEVTVKLIMQNLSLLIKRDCVYNMVWILSNFLDRNIMQFYLSNAIFGE